jgi:hypothetical protein
MDASRRPARAEREDDEESRILARARRQQLGHGPGAQQALTLRNLRNRQISGNRVQPSQPYPAPKEAASTVLNVSTTGAILWTPLMRALIFNIWQSKPSQPAAHAVGA